MSSFPFARRALRLCIATCLLASPWLAYAQMNGFYRFPSLHGDQVWFTAEGDIWRVSAAGGRAERVTTNPRAETRPSVSPDGKWLAFNGAYEGPTEVYVMAVDGGVPKRLTFGGLNATVWGWTPGGEVVVTAPSTSGAPNNQLYAIDRATLATRAFPVGLASDGALAADGKTLYFTRYGLRGDNVRGYRGGAMPRLWTIDTSGTAEAKPFADAATGSRRPMPFTDAQGKPRVAFLSDRDGSFNVWSVDAAGNDAHQHTRYTATDVRYASIDGTRVAYAVGADLHVVDLATDNDRAVAITLGGDFDQQRTRWVKPIAPFLTSVRLAPDGEHAAFTARGRIATQGVGAWRRAELPVPASTRCREAVFSHDSKHVLAWCDSSGEMEIWRFAANGSGTPVPMTRGAQIAEPPSLYPSPDGKWAAWFDKNGRLWLTALKSDGFGTSHAVDAPRFLSDPVLNWSPDSHAIAYARSEVTGSRSQLMLYTLADAKVHVLTSDRYDTNAPAFTPDGKWLYFLSDRNFTLAPGVSVWGDRNMGPTFDRRTRVYALALQRGLRFPYQAHDELESPASKAESASAAASAASGAASAAAKPGTPAKPLPALVTDGLASRLYEVPVPAGNYTWLDTDGKRLYLLENDSGADRKASLRTLAIDANAPTLELFAADVKSFELTPDGKKLMLVKTAPGDSTGDVLIVDAAPKLAPDTSKNQVRWADWQIVIEPRAEWQQLFNDAWRMHRDTFYEPNMLGVDWADSKRRHEPLLARVTDRDELAELMAQMVSELHTLHSAVGPGNVRIGPDEVPAAALGGRFVKTTEGFRVERIYRGDPELPSEQSPLAQAHVEVGEVVTAVNGRPTLAVADLSELLRGQVGRQMLLTLKGRSAGKSHDVIVTPVAAVRDRQLATTDWETSRAERVATQSGGKVGYLRLRAMGPADIATFAREFYANVERGGLVIDVRNNNGGNIDSWVIEKLMRRAWSFWQPRAPAGAPPYPNMQNAFRGYLAVLINEETYSDGESFAEGVKRLKLGALIGKRTSGAGVWLSDRNRLEDNGIMRAAQNPVFTLDGTWLVEGHGVVPDIEVDNLPRATFDGGDAQLDAAIAHLKARLAEQPIVVPVAPKR